MSEDHPNIALLAKLNLRDLGNSTDLFADDFVWHYFNPELPDVQGDYAGVTGLQTFFETLGTKSDGTFNVAPVSATAIGDELVVVHVRNTMIMQGQSIAIDAVVVWRFVDGRIAEAWDIPAIHTSANPDIGVDTKAMA